MLSRLLPPATALVLAVAPAAPAPAQEATGRVDYIAGATLYLAVPAAGRWVAGDTVRLARLRDADWLGQARVLGVAEARLSAEWLPGPVPLVAGDSVRIELPRARIDSLAVRPEALARDDPAALPGDAPLPRAPGRSGLSASGRLGLEFDALRSRASGGGAIADNTSLLPAIRLRAAVGRLPGDLELRANLRGSYRHDDAGSLVPAAQLFVNELSIGRDGRMLQVRAGRFPGFYEPYSGYWDGASVRIGPEDRIGVGVAFGFDPRYGNQAIDDARRKAAAFVDLHGHGLHWRYDGDLSVHRSWEGDTAVATAVGWSQQLGIGGLRLTQLLRADQGADGWTIGLAQFATSAPLAPQLRLRLRFTHDDPTAFYRLPAGTRWSTRRVGGTLSWFGSAGAAGIDVAGSWSRRPGEAERDARTLGAWLDVRRLPLVPLGFELSGSAWASGEERLLSIGPVFRYVAAGTTIRAGYQLLHQRLTWATSDLHAATADFGWRLGHGDLSLQLRHETGGGIAYTRVLSAFWVPL